MAEKIAVLAIQLGLILFLAKIFGMAAAKLKIPPVMGELVVGIVFGPFCLGGVGLPVAGFEAGLFPKSAAVPGIPVDPTLYAVATLGSIALLFNSGLETDVRTFFKYSVAGTVVGIGGIVCSFLCGAAVGRYVLGWAFMDPRTLFLGILCTATSVGISARILSERHAMGSPEGVTIMAAAVIDDVLGIVCLAVVIGIASVELRGGSMDWAGIGWITARSFGIWLGVTAIGLALSNRIAGFLKWFKKSRFFAVQAFGFSLLLAGLFEKAGLAMIIGAFVMGLSLSKTDVAFKIRAALLPICNFLVPVFFVVMGMLVDVGVLRDPKVLGVGLVFALMATLGKVVGCAVPALAMNFNGVGALRIGVGMVPRCEVVLIIAGIAATTLMKDPAGGPDPVPVFDSRLFGIAIIMPLVTALLAPPLLNAALAIRRKGVRREVADKGQVETKLDFRTEAIAYFAFNQIVELLHHDGFAYSTVARGVRVVQFRKDKTSFSLQIQGTVFTFISAAEDVPFIRTVLYEGVVELHKSLSELKCLAAPDAVKDALNATPAPAPAAGQGRKPAPALTLDRIVTPENIVVGLAATSKEEAFRELLAVIGRRTPVADPERCLRDILDREAIVSTYQENGIALPHARTDGAAAFATAIGIVPGGFDYDPGEPDRRARIVILSLCPKDEPGPYLQFIAQVSQVLMQDPRREAVLAAKTAEEAARIFHRVA